jgi:hypothetical protein
LKLPISSFFLVSTLMSGRPAAVNAARPSRGGERRALLGDVVKLGSPLRVRRAGFDLLGIDVQGIAPFAQQAGYRRRTDRMARRRQPGAQRPQATAHPLLATHRVARCFGGYHLFQGGDYGRIFFSRTAKTAGG